jgi:hypothetical protein
MRQPVTGVEKERDKAAESSDATKMLKAQQPECRTSGVFAMDHSGVWTKRVARRNAARVADSCEVSQGTLKLAFYPDLEELGARAAKRVASLKCLATPSRTLVEFSL